MIAKICKHHGKLNKSEVIFWTKQSVCKYCRKIWSANAYKTPSSKKKYNRYMRDYKRMERKNLTDSYLKALLYKTYKLTSFKQVTKSMIVNARKRIENKRSSKKGKKNDTVNS